MAACFFSYSFIYVVAPSGREGCVLSSFCAFFFYCYFSFLGGKVNFSLHVGGVMVSSSAGQTLTYVSILET